MYVVLTIQDGLPTDASDLIERHEDASALFLSTMHEKFTNADEYTAGDWEKIVDKGYEKWGNGSICLLDLDGIDLLGRQV